MKKPFRRILTITCLIFTLIPRAKSQNLTDSLISVWEFDETSGTTAFDSNGSNDMTVAEATTSQIGKINKCFTFDGVDDYVYVNSQLVPNYPFTLSVWVKTSTAGTGTIVSIGNSADFNDVAAIGLSSGYPRLANYATSYYEVVYTSIVSDNQWHHIVGVYESTTSKKLYVDGVLGETLTAITTFPYSVNQFTTGRLARNQNDGYFTGLIDQPAIWNRALTETEISELYNSGNGLPYSQWSTSGGGGTADNLGNHTAIQNIKLNGYWFSNDGGNEGVKIDNSGNVGINTNPDVNYVLSANGIVRAKEVVVESDWADYVFDNGYNLMTLEEIENFIKANGHLPEIPSAKEVEANGVDLGEMNMLLLKKVEELTLYIIDQQKEIKTLKKFVSTGLIDNK